MFVVYRVDEEYGDVLVHGDFYSRKDANSWVDIFGCPDCLYKIKPVRIPQS